MGWTTSRVSNNGAVVDPQSVVLNSGRQIDWAKVAESFENSQGNKEIPALSVMSETADGKLVPRTSTSTLTSVVVSSNVAMATKTAHGFQVGETVRISGASLAYANGLKTITTVTDADHFSFEATGANATASGTILAVRRATVLLATPAVENSQSDATSGYGCIIGGVFYENLLPDATGSPATLPAEFKEELNATGTGFAWERYEDTRAA